MKRKGRRKEKNWRERSERGEVKGEEERKEKRKRGEEHMEKR